MLKQSRSKRKISRTNWQQVLLYILISLSWAGFIFIFFFVNPNKLLPYFYTPFWFSIWLVLASTLYLITKKLVYSLFPSSAIVLILILRSWDFRQWYYPLLIIGLTTTLIYFFTTDQDNGIVSDDSLIN